MSAFFVSLYNPMDCSLPGSSVPGILQARILEWVLPNPGIEARPPALQADCLLSESPEKPLRKLEVNFANVIIEDENSKQKLGEEALELNHRSQQGFTHPWLFCVCFSSRKATFSSLFCCLKLQTSGSTFFWDISEDLVREVLWQPNFS